jgi:hypothetical protein
MIIAVIVADIIMAATYFFLSAQLPPQIPLFYARPWGEDQLADLWLIIVLPILMHVFIIGNKLSVRFLFKNDDLIRKTFAFADWFYIIVFTVIFIRILFLVS